ncbi:MAG: phasin family protein [Casimicrobiaceae bacterium]
MRNSIESRSNPVGDAVLNASRQMWLASLGAAVVTRDWAQSEAGQVFRTLVREGTAVESRTIRLVGDRLEGSFAVANTIWKQARTTVHATVKQAADTAVTLVQSNLPRSLPKVTLPAMMKAAAPAKAAKRVKRATKAKRATTKRTATKRAPKVVARAKRTTKTTRK